MIVYSQAFDLYHSIFRILHLLDKFEEDDTLELDRVRMWDFYLLFPEQSYKIRLKNTEKDVREIRKKYITKTKNPYSRIPDNRKMFEKLKPYQISALNCIASYGIISKENLALNRVTLINKKILEDYVTKVGLPNDKQRNVISLMTGHFNNMSLFGTDGFKDRTNLLESRYDA